jgi:hypothetical protein
MKVSVATLLLCLTAAGCSSPSEPSQPERSITVAVAGTPPRVGAIAPYTATAVIDGASQDVTLEALWQSSNINVLRVSPEGIVTGVGTGTAEVMATYAGITGRVTAAIDVPCTFTVSPKTIDAPAGGGTFTVGVAATQGSNCAWTATSHSPFITLEATDGGQATLRVSENTDVARTGSVTVADQAVFVSQPAPTGVIIERLTGTISADSSPLCSESFIQSVHPTYYFGGTQRCLEFPRRSVSGGSIRARLFEGDSRLDLDLVLNNGKGSNFRQATGGNKSGESLEFTLGGATDYAFVIYLYGVDAFFLANGGTFSGEVMTSFTLEIERPR